MKMEILAGRVYSEVFGHLDDKTFCARKTAEIAEWLAEGDLSDNPNVSALADEWREYDAADVEASA